MPTHTRVDPHGRDDRYFATLWGDASCDDAAIMIVGLEEQYKIVYFQCKMYTKTKHHCGLYKCCGLTNKNGSFVVAWANWRAVVINRLCGSRFKSDWLVQYVRRGSKLAMSMKKLTFSDLWQTKKKISKQILTFYYKFTGFFI